LEVARVVRKLSHFSLGLLLRSWGFSPFSGWRGRWVTRIRGVDAKGRHNWSMEQLLRTLGEGLHLLLRCWKVSFEPKTEIQCLMELVSRDRT